MNKDQIAIWKKKTKNGDTYLSVCLTINGRQEWVNVFKNGYKKEGDKKPDFKAKLGQDMGTYQSDNGGKNPPPRVRGSDVDNWNLPNEKITADDEVPF